MSPLEVRARPRSRSLALRTVGPSLVAAVGVGLVVTAARGDVFGSNEIALAALGTLLAVVGVAIVLQQLRLLSGVLLRLDEDGVHVRRERDFVSLGWDLVARVEVIGVRVGSIGGPGTAVLLAWVPCDEHDVDVPERVSEAERSLPLSPARSRLATVFNARERSSELRDVLAWVRRHQPAVEVLDLVLGTSPALPSPSGARVALLTHGSFSLLPQLVSELRVAGRTPVILASHEGVEGDGAAADALGAVIGRWGGPDLSLTDQCRTGLDGCVALIEIGVDEPVDVDHDHDRPDAMLEALSGRRRISISRRADRAQHRVDGLGTNDLVVLVPQVTEGPASGSVTLARSAPTAARPVSASDVAAVVVAVLSATTEGLVHLSAGTVPVADAVAGCAG